MKRSSYFLFILLVVGFVACQRKSNDRFTDTLTQGVIPIAVDETFKPIIDQEISVFEAVFPEAGIVPTFMSERDAVDLLLKDSVRLAITTRPLSAKEKAFLASKKFEPREYKLAVDGIALIVNKSNKDTLITVDQLRKILTGKITNWGEIHPGSNLGKINLVFDDPNSSTVRYAIDSICGGNKNLLSKNLSAQNSNKEVLEYVAKTSDAIGIIGVSWLSDTKDTTNLTFINTVRVMSVSNEVKATPQNSYKPYQAYLFYGDYPLTRNIFVILNDPRSSLPSGFTSFLTSDKGQRIILKAGLVPATQPIRIVNVKEQ